MASGFIDKAKFTGSRTGSGPVTGWVRVPPYRLPTDVKAIGDRIFLEVRDVNDDTIWEHGWYEIAAGGQLTLYAVVDTHQRAGEYVAGSPPAAISFGGPVEVGAIANSQTLPVIGPDGRLINGKAVRDSVLFPDIVTLQARSDLADGDVFFSMSSLYTPSGGGASTGAGPGLLLQFDADSAAAPDGVNVFDLSSGSPGRLIKASLEVQAQFIRERWSIYADAGGVSRLRQHVLARGAAGADAAWMGVKALRGTDVDPFTELQLVDNDRHAGLETPFFRARSFGGAKDVNIFEKPIALPSVAAKADVLAGRLARVATADKKIWLNDADRGYGEIPLQEGPYRAIVANIADLRLLTPDGYRDGEVVLVEGATFRGDDSFEVYWASASAAADNNSDVYKPDFHASGAAWVEPGRFIAVAPIRAIKFADDDATPSVAGSSVFTGPDVAPVGGITAFDDFRNNKRIKLQPGAVDLVLKQANSALELPGRVDFTLSSIANGGSPVFLEKENGVVSMVGGGASPAAVAKKFKELSGAVPAMEYLSPAIQAKVIGNTVTSGDWAAITAGLNAAIAAAVAEKFGKVLVGSGHWHTTADARIDNPGVVIAGADRETTHFWKHGFNDFFRTLGARPDVPGTGRLLASDTLANTRVVSLGAGGGAAFAAQTNALLVSEGLIQADRPQKRGQLVTILSISGDVITLRDYARQDFTVANTARLVPLSLRRGVGYRDFTLHMDTSITPPDSTSYFELFGIDVRFCEDVLIENVDIRDTVGAGIYLHGNRNVRVRNNYFKYFGSATSGGSSVVSIDGSPGFGYGVASVGLNEQISISANQAWALRHFYTTLETYGSETSTLAYGEPYNDRIADNIHYDSRDAAFDTHNAGDAIEFVNNQAIGGYAGLQNRSRNTRVKKMHGADLMGPVVWNRGGEGLADSASKGDYGTFDDISGERTNLGTNHTGTIDFRAYGAFTDDAYGSVLGKHRFSYCGGPAILIGRNSVARANRYAQGQHDFPNRVDTTRKASIWLENAQSVANIEIDDIYVRSDALTENLLHRQNDLSGGNPIPLAINNLRGSGFSGRSFNFVGSDRGVRLSDVRGSQIRQKPERTVLRDDFLGAVTHQWNLFNGTSASAAAVPGGSRDGRLRFTLGTDAAGTFAANGVAITSITSPWRVESGGLTALAYLYPIDTTVDDVAIFFGFRNAVSSNVMPFTLAAGDVLTANTITEGFGLLYDPAATTDQWALVGVKGGSVTGRLDFTGIVPVTSVLQQIAIEITAAGTARALIGGVPVAEIADAMTNTNIGLALTLAAFNRSTNANSMDVDFAGAEQPRA